MTTIRKRIGVFKFFVDKHAPIFGCSKGVGGVQLGKPCRVRSASSTVQSISISRTESDECALSHGAGLHLLFCSEEKGRRNVECLQVKQRCDKR
jgi:hypothetical protein